MIQMTVDRSWFAAISLAGSLLLALSSCGAGEIWAQSPAPGATSWLVAAPGYTWTFPRDYRSHPGYRTEWWYFTGQLQETPAAGAATPAAARSPRRFGYQFTFFRVGLQPEEPISDSAWAANNLVMGHASITDLDGDEHYFCELLYRATPLLGGFGAADDSVLVWSRGPAGTDTRWILTWQGDGFHCVMNDDSQGVAFSLRSRITAAPIFQGPDGYSRKGHGPRAASLYYSHTRLATMGHLTVRDEPVPVTGVSWMDREFGSNFLGEDQVGWDWLCLQLEDGCDLMLYRLRRADGSPDFARGTLVNPGGEVRHLHPEDWTWQGEQFWRSEITGASYPVRWRLRLPATPETAGRDLEIHALRNDQENVSKRSGVFYWEGAVEAVDAEGRQVGQGYVELTGYGEGSRPPI